MTDKTMRLRILTPFGTKVDENVNMVVMRCLTGDWGVLPGHAPSSAVLKYGALRMMNGDYERMIAVYGGIASVRDNVITVLTSEADWPEEIDLARARAEYDQAEQRLRERTDDIEMQFDTLRIRRALVQIEISAYSLTKQDVD